MSKRTSLIVAAAVVIAAIAAYIIVRNLPEEPYEPFVSTRITHLNALSTEIKEIRLDRGDGDILVIERRSVEVDGRSRSEWVVLEPELTFTPKSSSISDVGFSMSNIYSEALIEENPSDLSIYGLDKPTAHATISTINDEEVNVIVGAKSPTGVSYYVQVNGEETVYTMRKYTVDKMLTDVTSFRERIIPVPNLEAVTYLRIDSDRTIEISPLESMQEFELAATASLKITKPYTHPRTIDSQRFQETLELIPPSFSVVEFIEDNPTDLSKYGLDTPRYKFEIQDPEMSLRLLFGDEADEATAYVKFADFPVVFTLGKQNLQFLQVEAFTLSSKFLLIVDIKYVDSFTITGPEAKHVARIDRTGEDFDPETEDGAVYYLNDVEVEEKPFKKYYQAVIGLLTDAENPDTKPLSNSDVTVEYNLNDKVSISTVRLDLVEVSKDFYAAYRDGVSEFLLSDYQVENMFDTAAEVLSGTDNG